ncbi:MAG: hypothetical protein JO125_02700 [Chloroflexi bacterium]|nr:hypothetical protein [Ktedonobacteraceae bacterium]MBV8821443.1 hypothetical protein [Ktedonobacteraceae bacterium]MBV9706302.1 hypothetical protein [Chloroflexota bacterium]
MELSLRLDTLGIVDMRYVRGRQRYRDWPQFQLFAASRQARITAYMNREVAEQLHQQILMVETAIGMDAANEEEEEGDVNGLNGEEPDTEENTKLAERDSSAFSPALAQALKQLNELARQRLPEASTSQPSSELIADGEEPSEEDALEQLQDAFVQMMEVVRELAEELSTDALKITGRFKCGRTNIEFVSQVLETDEDDEEEQENGENTIAGIVVDELELAMILQLFEEGRTKAEDMPAVELQLDVDDFERLHETLDYALDIERRSVRRRR